MFFVGKCLYGVFLLVYGDIMYMNGSWCDGLVIRGSGLDDMIVRGRVVGWNSSGMLTRWIRLSSSWVVICDMVLSWWCVSDGDSLDISCGERSDRSGSAMVGSLAMLYLAYIAYVVRLVFCMIVSMMFIFWGRDCGGFLFYSTCPVLNFMLASLPVLFLLYGVISSCLLVYMVLMLV